MLEEWQSQSSFINIPVFRILIPADISHEECVLDLCSGYLYPEISHMRGMSWTCAQDSYTCRYLTWGVCPHPNPHTGMLSIMASHTTLSS